MAAAASQIRRRFNHHETLLKEMSDLTEAEGLTDLTVHCLDGRVFAHRKVLVSASPLIRRLTASASSPVVGERLHLVLEGVARSSVQTLLAVLYTGRSPNLARRELDQVLALCRQLEVDLGSSSIRQQSDSNDLGAKNNASLSGPKARPSPRSTLGVTSLSSPSEASVTASGKTTTTTTATKKNPSRRYCICREGESPGMIGCDFCDEWYHYRCLSLTRLEAKALAAQKWKCPNCELKDACQSKKNNGGMRTSDPNVVQQKQERPNSATSTSSTSTLSSAALSETTGNEEDSPMEETAAAPEADDDDRRRQSGHAAQPSFKWTKRPQEGSSGKEPLKVCRRITRGQSFQHEPGRGPPPGEVAVRKQTHDKAEDDLHFCYRCRSIFLSVSALEEHKRSHDVKS